MIENSSHLQADLVRLVDQGRRPDKTLAPRAQATALPATAGSARPSQPGGAGLAGIASPLTEPDYTTRTWHAARDISTTDGIFTFVVEDLATIDMLDANGGAVAMQFAAVPSP